MQEQKNSVCSISNISNHVFCLIKLNGLNEEHYFNEIAPRDTKIRIEVIF